MAPAGCQWRALPRDFPPYSAVQGYFYGWPRDGRFASFNHALVMAAREKAERRPAGLKKQIGEQPVCRRRIVADLVVARWFRLRQFQPAKHDASRSTIRIAGSVAPSSSAPASGVIAPPSNAATTWRPSTASNPNTSRVHSVYIGALLESSRSRSCKTTFADSQPQCA